MVVIAANGPGIGDAMVLSIIAREHRSQYPHELVEIQSCHPELFEGSPDVERATPWGGPCTRTFPELDDQAASKLHNIVFMCGKLGLSPPQDLRQFYYGPTERVREGGYVTISPHAGPWTRNKDWYDDSWKSLVSKTPCETVQLGAVGDRPISGADHSFLGCPLSVTAALLAHSSLHVCVVTGTMHLAAAFVETPCVVLFGGRENPGITGYPRHKHLVGHVDCAPCWKVRDCPHGTPFKSDLLKPCMDRITESEVLDACSPHFPD